MASEIDTTLKVSPFAQPARRLLARLRRVSLTDRRLWAAAAAITLISWPVSTIAAKSGFDYSGIAGEQLAHQFGLQFGNDVIFNYGPLGFLNDPVLFNSATGALGVLYTLLVNCALAGALLFLLRASLAPLAALAITWLFVSLGPQAMGTSELGAVAAFLWSTVALRGLVGRRTQTWLIIAGGALAAVELLVKLDSGILVLAVAAITAWALPPGRARSELRLLGSLGVALAALWFLSGQTLNAVPGFLHTTVDNLSGYTDSASIELSHKWDYPVAILLTGLIALLVRRTRRPANRYLYPLAVAVFLYVEFRHGFVRHDPFHADGFFLAAALVPLGMMAGVAGDARVRRRALAVSAVATLVLLASLVGVGALFKSLDALKLFQNPVTAVRNAESQVATLALSGRRHAEIDRSKAAIRATLGLTPSELANLRGQTVHVDPMEVTAVWAYGLNWRPVPVYQPFNVYTTHLDQLEAGALTSARAPSRVLRIRPPVVFDKQSPVFQSPAYMVALECNYRPLSETAKVQVLAHTTGRCGAARAIGSAQVAPGQSLAVPAGSAPNELVYARFHISQSLPNRLAGLLFKPLQLPAVVLDGTRYRLIAHTAADPHLLRLPRAGTFAPDFAASPAVHTLQLANVSGTSTVGFYEMPISAH